MDIRFLNFVKYLEKNISEYDDITILEEQQAIQIVAPLKNRRGVKFVYDFVFRSECIDTMEIVAFYAPVKNISRELLLTINQCNKKSQESLYVLHEGQERIYLRILREVFTLYADDERNKRIMKEYEEFQEEISNSFNDLAPFIL